MDDQRVNNTWSLLTAFVLMLMFGMCARPTLAQDTSCGFDLIPQQRIDYSLKTGRSDVLHVIPVVVHVVHLTTEPVGTGSNISDAQVVSAIDEFNFYMQTNIHGDPNIRLCLAEVDPDGNYTTGINRVALDGEYALNGVSVAGGAGIPDGTLKLPIAWPKQDYYNIYTVTEINGNNGGGGIQGYAYFPTASIVDGTVCLFNAFGVVGNLKSYTNQNKTFIHEIGHALGLYHTFQSTSSCTSETDCLTQGDRLCDTPPHNQTNSCTENCPDAPILNHMSYSPQTCRTQVTPDGIDRMRATLENSSQRNTLLESDKCSFDFGGCVNDLCENAIQIGCSPTNFSNIDCNLFDFSQNNMSMNVGNCNNSMMSSCGAGAGGLQSDVWFSFEITETGYYDLNTFSDYDCTDCGSASGIQTYLWYTPDGCEDAYIVYSQYCAQSVCWGGAIGDYTGDEGGYGQQSYSMMIDFLQTGQYYFQIDGWGWGQNHPEFDYSSGSGTVSICQTIPLSTKPELFISGNDLYWTGETTTHWTVFKLDNDLNWKQIGQTDEKTFEITENGYYIVANNSGFSNALHVQFESNNQPTRYDIIGREGVKIGIVR